MRAITLTQPWATLHVARCAALGGKPPKGIESRGWKLDIPDGGAPIVVHAAKGIARDIRDLVSGGEYFRDPFAHWLEACGYSALDPWRKGYISNFRKDSGGAWYSDQEGKLAAPLPLGACVGGVWYDRIERGTDILAAIERGEYPEHERDLGFYDESDGKRYGWIVGQAMELSEPIPYRGAQGIWRLPDFPQLAFGMARLR